ncbi:42380_t:CDS:2 [Gigaspora margarita]|uniref:42380_t:CDS:1 n=1 Tax=Gigaspora margarita TaxID=4874 RepID=A0ABM8W4S2_GIGMA|nr:42380_t:CDS:2 [Gigaspora margarita]
MRAAVVQVNEKEEVSLKEVLAYTTGWPSSMRAELLAIWIATLISLSKTELVVKTDSTVSIMNIKSSKHIAMARYTSTNIAGNNTIIRSKSNISIRTSGNTIEIKLSSEYKSDSLSLVDSEVDYNTEGDDYFQNNNNSVKLTITINKLFNKTKNENESNNKDITKQDEISTEIEIEKIEVAKAVTEIVGGEL